MMKLVVLSCVLAAAAASGVYVSPIAPLAPFAYASYYQPTNYRGPLSLAPGQPANILGADGRPLDTLEVNVDRAAHYTAKALNGDFHLLKKRSVIAPYAAPFYSGYASGLAYAAPFLEPFNYRGPLSLAPGQPANILGADGRPLDTLDVNLDRAAHFAAKTGLHILKKRSATFYSPISSIAIARTPLIASTYAYATPFAPTVGRIAPTVGRIAYTSPIVRIH